MEYREREKVKEIRDLSRYVEKTSGKLLKVFKISSIVMDEW